MGTIGFNRTDTPRLHGLFVSLCSSAVTRAHISQLHTDFWTGRHICGPVPAFHFCSQSSLEFTCSDSESHTHTKRMKGGHFTLYSAHSPYNLVWTILAYSLQCSLKRAHDVKKRLSSFTNTVVVHRRWWGRARRYRALLQRVFWNRNRGTSRHFHVAGLYWELLFSVMLLCASETYSASRVSFLTAPPKSATLLMPGEELQGI